MNRLLLSLVCLWPAHTAGADELRFDAPALLDQWITSDVRLSADGSAVELERGVLIEDDGPAAGFSYQPNEERLSATTWIKKEFLIPDARADKATLLVGPGGKLQGLINGRAHELRDAAKVGQYWQAYALPAAAFRSGKNDVVLYGAGKVWIARADEFAAGSRTQAQHPNRSARSDDSGQTWDDQRLGPRGDIDGEYCVRLFLDQYRPRGLLTSPVIDLGNLTGQPISAAVDSPGPVRVRIDAATRPGQHIGLKARTGTNLAPAADGWSDWSGLGAGGELAKPAGRFLQLAIELSTTDGRSTPAVQRLVVEAAPPQLPTWTGALRVLESHNEEIVRSSIPFAYEPWDHPRLKTLRQQYRLDEVVEGAASELELIGRLAAWSARQWQRGHLKDIYPAWDALEILKPHADGTPVGGFCQQYNLVFLQACASFGLVGRAVSLGPGSYSARIRSGHEVVEIWSSEHRKWIYVDGQAAWYFTDQASGIPLSLLELRARQLAVLQGQLAAPVQLVRVAETEHRWQGLDSFPPFVELRLIPRSNFLAEAAPLPLNQGMRGWFWTGHHVWSDAQAPAPLLYSQRVTRRRNWQWTLNHAHYRLEAHAERGVLRVHLDTETPGFDTFLADIDGAGKRPVVSGFLWRLHEGRNRLDIRPRNRAGREGSASWVGVDLR